MVSALDSESGGSHSLAGWIIVLCSWAKQFTFVLPLSPPRSISIGVAVPSPHKVKQRHFILGKRVWLQVGCKSINVYRWIVREAYQRGNLVMDWHPIKGGGGEKGRQLKYHQLLHAEETGISWIGLLAVFSIWIHQQFKTSFCSLHRQFKPRKCQIVIDFTSIDGFPSKRSLSVASP